ncbi:MAG: right-handed parallel beta-helix repeat-containing protein [Oscillospiraceae bacterium]|jgi:polygalacturonase|nr:right-handed parallel beta-helix repeat-containing protein [Oscillospiraceae bacterium]
MMKTTMLHPEDGARTGDGYDFTGVIEQAAAALGGSGELRFAAGTYHFFPQKSAPRALYISNTDCAAWPEKRCGVYLEGCRGLTLAGEGAAFVFHGPLTALAFVDCSDLHISGIAVDYHCPSTVDLTVMDVSDDKTVVTVTYPAVYTCEAAAGGVLFRGDVDPYTGELLFSLHTAGEGIAVQRFEAHSGMVYRINSNPFSTCVAVETDVPGRVTMRYSQGRDVGVGDCFQLRNTKRDGCGIFAQRCRNLTFADLRIGYLYAFGVMAQCCENVSFEAVRFRAEQPGRMTASAADMIQCVNCSGAVQICHCDFHNPHDDPINIHGVFLRLEELRGARAVLRFMHHQTFGYPCIFPGDEIQFYDSASLLPAGEPLRVLAAEGPDDADRYRIAVTLASAPALPPGAVYAAENVTRIPDVTIAHNRFVQIPTRGLLVSANRRVVVRDNLFSHIHMSAIYISGDATGWYESGPVRDVVIAGNVFEDCNRAVLVEPTNTVFVEETVHHNIRIEGNAMRNVPFPPISVKSSDGVVICGNTVQGIGELVENIHSKIILDVANNT